VNVPPSWTGPNGHVLLQPWFPARIRDNFTALITELETAAPAGLPSRRTDFRSQGQAGQGSPGLSAENQAEQAMARVLEIRAELLIGMRLVRAGVLRQMSRGTPDFECEHTGHEFGVEVTTRACDDVAGALNGCLERKLEAGPAVRVMLMRQGDPVFHLAPEKIDQISDQIVAHAATLADTGTGRVPGNMFIAEAGLNAVFMPGDGTMPGMRVTFQLPETDDQWERHWTMAALLMRNRIESKGRKQYAMPSITAVDVSRLGEAGRWPTGPWTANFQEVLDNCDLGNLQGVLVFRSTLDSLSVEPLAWRGSSPTAVLAAGAVLLGGALR
jgi:hypothetical protein